MRLHKYRSLSDFRFVSDILINSRFYAAKFSDLNDPMEGLFQYAADTTNHDLEQIIMGKQNLRICSFSRDPGNAVMWAHYADDFRGICLEVDVNERGIGNHDVVTVEYSNRPILFSRNDNRPADDISREALSRKITDWRYEREVRILTPNEFVREGLTIRNILVGLRTDENLKRALIAIVKSLNYQVSIYETGIGGAYRIVRGQRIYPEDCTDDQYDENLEDFAIDEHEIISRSLIHELRTPLTIIQNQAFDISNKWRIQDTDKIQSGLRSLINTSEQMRYILEKYHLYWQNEEKIQSRDFMGYQLESDILRPVINSTSSLLDKGRFSKNSIKCFGFENAPPLFVNKVYLEVIFYNLLSNAIKYAHKDARSFLVQIYFREDGNWFNIRVEDFGLGIDPAIEDNIFDLRVHSPNKSRLTVSGNGVGLWIVRKILGELNGTIVISSRANPTAFTIRLPRELAYRR